MNQSRCPGALPFARKFFGVLVVLSLLTLSTPARAQHEGHNMPAPARPKAKAARKPAPKKAVPRRTTPRRATRRTATQPATRRTVAAPAGDVARPVDPHAGHMQQATPTPTPAPTPDPHAGHVMPQATAPVPRLAPGTSPQQHQQGHGQSPAQQPSASPTPGGQQQQQQSQAVDHSMHQMTPQQQQGTEKRMARSGLIPEGPVVTLDQLERMAVERNPTLAQAKASIRAAEGRRRQAGAFPNPTVGYFGEELAFRALSDNSEHGVFVEQTFPLGGKLGKSKRIFEREREQAEIIAEAQGMRVTNSVRMLYFETLGAQQLVELRADLADLAREAVEITRELYNVGQADRPDQLEIEIEAERAEIESLRARTDWEQAWSALGAMVGDPGLRPARLAGSLEEGAATLDQEALLMTLLSTSPEIRAARAGVERARAVASRERAERIPDLFVNAGVGYNNEILERDGRKTGAEGRIEVGVNIPIFNRNKGGIAAAEADLAIAERELERLQLSLRSRMATSFLMHRLP